MKMKLPWRLTHRGGIFNTCVRAPLRRWRLRRQLLNKSAYVPNAITVVIPVRNRADHRLRNTLSTLAAQDYPRELIQITVVDYGSAMEARRSTASLCTEYNAKIIELPGKGVWNKPKCANYAIKRCQTEFLMSVDADNIFPTNFISELISALKSEPLSVVYSQMLDLDEDRVPLLMELSERNLSVPYEELEKTAVSRGAGDKHPGTFGTYTLFFNFIRGYDEQYEEWGWEDNDIMERFIRLGLERISIKTKAKFLHQWHPKGEGSKNWRQSAMRNRIYYEGTSSIMRNQKGWGEG